MLILLQEVIIMLGKISQKLMGYRVQAAREAKGLTQTQLTESLDLKNRQSISSIENGERAVKTEELLLLTEALDCDIEFFLDPFSVVGEAKFSWRASSDLEEKTLDNFELQTGRWIGLLRWLREIDDRQTNPLKYALRLTKQSSFEDAMNCAENLVEKLDLGFTPANTLIEQVEKKLDIPVLFVDTIETPEGLTISGASCHLRDLGVILINRNEPKARRFYDLAHELFHILTWDTMKPDHRESNSLGNRTHNKRIEHLADNFAAAILMPQKSLQHFIDDDQINNIDHLSSIATELKVTSVALAWRLYNLKKIDHKTLLALKHKKLTLPESSSPKRFQSCFVNMLYHAIDKGQLSARKAAKAMSMDLTQLINLFTEHSLPAPFEL